MCSYFLLDPNNLVTVLRIRDPGSGAFLTPESRIAFFVSRISNPYIWKLSRQFLGNKYATWYLSRRYGSEDPDSQPVPYQNVTDPEDYLYYGLCFRWGLLWSGRHPFLLWWEQTFNYIFTFFVRNVFYGLNIAHIINPVQLCCSLKKKCVRCPGMFPWLMIPRVVFRLDFRGLINGFKFREMLYHSGAPGGGFKFREMLHHSGAPGGGFKFREMLHLSGAPGGGFKFREMLPSLRVAGRKL